jgi:tetratricopeptide (TPR) repeat protein
MITKGNNNAMRKITFYGFGLGLILAMLTVKSNAQGQQDVKNSGLYRHYQMKYIFAMKYNDDMVAKDALYNLIAMDPVDDSVKMRLCYHYFERNQFASSLFITEDLLAVNPDNIDALRLNAVSYQRMGVRDKAISSFETLYLKTSEIGVLYEAALLQFELERFTECKTNLDIVIKHPQAKVLKLNLSVDDKTQKEITLEAAAYNAKGMAEKMSGNTEEARNNFNKALELEPEFELAKQNLDEL